MDTSLGALASSTRIVPLHDPSVLIVESHPKLLDALSTTLKSTMPGVAFESYSSQDDGLSQVQKGRYYAVIGDSCVAEAAEYSLLKRTQSLSCPVPFLLSERPGDSLAISGALLNGAFDVIRSSFDGVQAAAVVRWAFWLYQLRSTIHHRRQRLVALRLRHSTRPVTHYRSSYLIERTIHNIEEANLLCERTIQQIESSIRVLQEICDHFESDARECALRLARLL